MPDLTPAEQALKMPADESFHRREWIVQRIGWGAMILLVLAAALGLLGPGPLSSASAGNEKSLLVDYQRFCRLEAKSELRIHASGAAAAGESVDIWISRSLLERGQIEQITPEPAEVRSEADRILFRFGRSEEEPAVVRFHIRPQRVGRASGGVGVAGGASVSLSQFTYP